MQKSMISSTLFLLVCIWVNALLVMGLSASASHIACHPETSCTGGYSCPAKCPRLYSGKNFENPDKKFCYIDCDAPLCRTRCTNREPITSGFGSMGSACTDPNFIHRNGTAFYSPGKSNNHFCLHSDHNFQLNGDFVSHRSPRLNRDCAWIQALGILFKSQVLSLEAINEANWDYVADHIKLIYNRAEIILPEGVPSSWSSPSKDIMVERVHDQNRVMISLEDAADIFINVVPLTKYENNNLGYRLPSIDRFAHLEVAIRFFDLSATARGLLSSFYWHYLNRPLNISELQPPEGAEEKYRTSSLLSVDCKLYAFKPESISKQLMTSLTTQCNTPDCNTEPPPPHDTTWPAK